jgi:hypothetical protein
VVETVVAGQQVCAVQWASQVGQRPGLVRWGGPLREAKTGRGLGDVKRSSDCSEMLRDLTAVPGPGVLL